MSKGKEDISQLIYNVTLIYIIIRPKTIVTRDRSIVFPALVEGALEGSGLVEGALEGSGLVVGALEGSGLVVGALEGSGLVVGALVVGRSS